MARLGDICEKVTDYVASGSFAALKENVLITNEENYAIMVKTADFSNGFTKALTYTDKRGYDFLKNSNLFGGELILSNIGSIGKVFKVPYLDRPMTLASNTVMIKTATPELTDYLYYYFLSPAGYKSLLSISSGTSMLKFNKTELKKLEIPIPDIDKQRRIIAVMDKVSNLISLRKQQLAKLDELVKARFVELFGDTILNPFGWKKDLLGTVCDVRDGTHDSPQYYESGYPLVTSKNVTGGKIDLTDCSLICEADFKKINERSKVDIGDIIMPMIGTVGKPVIVDIEPNFAIKNVSLIKFKADSRVLNTYIRALLQSDYFDDAVLSKVRGGTQKFISLGDIRKLEVLVPPMELQEQFATFIKQTDKSKLAIQQSLDKLETLKRSLMQKYFG